MSGHSCRYRINGRTPRGAQRCKVWGNGNATMMYARKGCVRLLVRMQPWDASMWAAGPAIQPPRIMAGLADPLPGELLRTSRARSKPCILLDGGFAGIQGGQYALLPGREWYAVWITHESRAKRESTRSPGKTHPRGVGFDCAPVLSGHQHGLYVSSSKQVGRYCISAWKEGNSSNWAIAISPDRRFQPRVFSPPCAPVATILAG